MNWQENIVLYDFLLENLGSPSFTKNGWGVKIFRIYYLPFVEFTVYAGVQGQQNFYHESVKLAERLEDIFPKIKKIVEYILRFDLEKQIGS